MLFCYAPHSLLPHHLDAPEHSRHPVLRHLPNLRELGLSIDAMEDSDLAFLLDRSPVLEILNIEGCRRELRLRLVSQSLRCVQICSSVMEDITMVKAPCRASPNHFGAWGDVK